MIDRPPRLPWYVGKHSSLGIVLAGSFGLGLLSGYACGQDLPPHGPADETESLWEVGLGGFVAVTPNYPASAEYDVNGLPIPLVIYRGDLFRLSQEEGARLVPLDTERVEIGVSADAAFGADSDDNALREGLPDLAPLVEVGPEIVLKGRAFGVPAAFGTLEAALQGRAVFSVDFDDGVDYRGLVLEPLVRTGFPGLLGRGTVMTLSAGPIFATSRLHEFFYEVPVRFARPGRPAFDAEGGYLGTEVNLGLAVELTDRLDLFLGGEVGLYAGAANADSPLFEEEVGASVFLGLAYSLFQSERRVPRRR